MSGPAFGSYARRLRNKQLRAAQAEIAARRSEQPKHVRLLSDDEVLLLAAKVCQAEDGAA